MVLEPEGVSQEAFVVLTSKRTVAVALFGVLYWLFCLCYPGGFPSCVGGGAV